VAQPSGAVPEKAATLASAALATLTPEEQRACRALAWQDRLVSLWAPVTVLALVLPIETLPVVPLVELPL